MPESSRQRSGSHLFPKALAWVVCATISATFGVGCSSGNSTPPESLLQSSLSELAADDAKGLVSFTNIRKLDGQLQPDGINYVMDYEARFTTNKCIEYETYADGMQDIPLNVLEERSAKKKLTWCTSYRAKFLNGGSGRFWGAGYSADITGQVLFTKKEKGWVLVKALLPLKKMHGTGELAWRDPVLASQEQVSGGISRSAGVKSAVTQFYQEYDRYPSSNREANVAEANRLKGEFVSSIAMRNGVITISYGNDAEESIFGKTILLEPKLDESGTLHWTCQSTEIADQYLPEDCR